MRARMPAPALERPAVPVIVLPIVVTVEADVAAVVTLSSVPPAARIPPERPVLPSWVSRPPLLNVSVAIELSATAPPEARFRELSVNEPPSVEEAPSTTFSAAPRFRAVTVSEAASGRKLAPAVPSVVAKPVPFPVAEGSMISQGRMPLVVVPTAPDWPMNDGAETEEKAPTPAP